MNQSFPSRHAGPGASRGDQLLRVTNTWQRAVNAALLPHGLTQAQFAVLAVAGWMHHTSGPGLQIDIARAGAIDEMMTSPLLRALEARGLVDRRPDRDDRRARRVWLTPGGRRLLKSAMTVVENVDDMFFLALRDPDSFAAPLRELVPQGANASAVSTGAGPALAISDGGAGRSSARRGRDKRSWDRTGR